MREINEHFRVAFYLSGRANLEMMPKQDSGDLIPEILDQYITPQIDEARERWTNASDFPDLMRHRDRHAFREVARLTGNVFIVCAADRFAGQLIGKPGYKPCPYRMLGVSRGSTPNQGLLAADPEAKIFREFLNSMKPPRDYRQYKEALARLGLRVGGEEDGYIIRDQLGSAFYSAYYLHGVYKQENGSNAWTGVEGEKIRAELNRRMGEELILFGPHDIWDHRPSLPSTSPLKSPQPPVIFFLPSGDVEVRMDTASMELYYRYLGIDWDSLYVGNVQATTKEGVE